MYAVDLIGEPGFSAAARPPLESDAYASWLDDVWKALGLASASIVGVSLGGWLGLDYAARRPERVASLSLVSPSGIGAPNHRTLVKAALLLMLGTWGVNRSLKLVSGRASVPPEVSDFVRLIFRHFRPRLEKIPRHSDDELASLAMPIQVIVGGADALIYSSETRARVELLMPHAEMIYLEREGHLLPPQTATIARFLDRVVAGRFEFARSS